MHKMPIDRKGFLTIA